LIFFILGIIFHGTPKRFLAAITTAVKTAGGIIFQFPFYAGIMGMMIGANSEGLSLGGAISNFFMDNVIAYFAPLFEFVLALGETGIGILLILGLFTTIAAFVSLALTLMVIVGSLISYQGLFLSDLVWYLVASIALVNIGGNRQVLALDYYVMPKAHAFLQRIPLFKKLYLYGDRIDFTRPNKVE